MKKILAITGILILLALVAGFFLLKGKRHEIVITQGDVDSALREHFPATKSFLLIFDMTYSDPEVTLLDEEDKIRVKMRAEVGLKGSGAKEPFGGTATVVSGLRYDPDDKEFFLEGAAFEKLEIQGIPEKHLDKVTKAATEFGTMFLERWPVYRLEGNEKEKIAARMLLKGMEIRDQSIWVTLGL